MKSRNNVKFDEKSDLNQTIEGLLQLRNWVSVFNDNVVKFSVIHIYLNIFFKFANKDYQRVDEECAEAYEFFLKVFIQSFLEHFKLISGYEI